MKVTIVGLATVTLGAGMLIAGPGVVPSTRAEVTEPQCVSDGFACIAPRISQRWIKASTVVRNAKTGSGGVMAIAGTLLDPDSVTTELLVEVSGPRRKQWYEPIKSGQQYFSITWKNDRRGPYTVRVTPILNPLVPSSAVVGKSSSMAIKYKVSDVHRTRTRLFAPPSLRRGGQYGSFRVKVKGAPKTSGRVVLQIFDNRVKSDWDDWQTKKLKGNQAVFEARPKASARIGVWKFRAVFQLSLIHI